MNNLNPFAAAQHPLYTRNSKVARTVASDFSGRLPLDHYQTDNPA
jgi:hypothetical protein